MKKKNRKSKRTDWLRWEKALIQEGFSYVAGVDEVGRGPLAGPVVAAAVIFQNKKKIKGINDSKKLSAPERELLFKQIREKALSVGVAVISSEQIDRYNILNASLLAMKEAILNLNQKPNFVLVDGREKIPQLEIPQKAIIKGDSQSQSIAAAAIVAKVTRDGLMEKLHRKYPEFGFGHNQGYGTKEHKEALVKFGPTPIHRKSFAPVSQALSKQKERQLDL